MNITTSPPAAPPVSRLARVPLPAQILLLAALVGAAAYLWSAPWRAERFYARATLPQLQAEAARRPDDPRVLHHLALRLQQADRPQEALAAALHAAERAPFDEDAYLMAAAFSGRIHGDQSAFDILGDFVRRNPGAARAHRALALLYQKNGAHERAFDEATKAAAANPKDASAFRIAADEALAMHKTDAAEADARRAVALASDDPQNHLILAAVLDHLGRADDARAAAEAAVKVAPQNGEAHLALGGLLRRQNRHEEALAELTEAARLLPGTGAPTREIGRVQFSLGHYAAARPALERARDALPEDRTTSWLLTETYRRLGDTKAAAGEAQRFAALTAYQDRVEDLKLKINKGIGDEAGLRHELARLLWSHGDLAGARQQYRLLILHQPDAVGNRHQLAALDAVAAGDIVRARREAGIAGLLDKADRAIAANQAEHAVAPLETAIQANPEVADLYDRLGRALGQASGVEDQAEAALVKATKLEPQRTDLALDAAEMLAANKKADAAEAEYRRALALAPNDAQVRGALGRFLANDRPEPEKNIEGERLLQALLATNPANADALYGLGTLALTRGDGKAAAGYFESFLSNTGQRAWPDVWFSLARAYQLSGDAEKAVKARAEYTRLTGQQPAGGGGGR
jgi:tetratricopeptide (TPR) repeat protein